MPTDHDRLRQYTEFLLDEPQDQYKSFAAWTEPSLAGDTSRASLCKEWLRDKHYTLDRSMLLFKHLAKTGIVEPRPDEAFGIELLKFLSDSEMALPSKELTNQQSWSDDMIKSGTMTLAQLAQHLKVLHETVGNPGQYRATALNSLKAACDTTAAFLTTVKEHPDQIPQETASFLSVLLMSDHITRLRQPLQILQSMLEEDAEESERLAMQRLLAEE